MHLWLQRTETVTSFPQLRRAVTRKVCRSSGGRNSNLSPSVGNPICKSANLCRRST